MRCFGVVRFGSVWFSGVRWPKKRAQIKNDRGARHHMLLLKHYHLLVRWGLAGLAGFGWVWQKKTGCVVFVWWFGLIR